MVSRDYPFSSEGLTGLYTDLAPPSLEQRLVGEVVARQTLKPAAALIRLVDGHPDIVTVRFSRGGPASGYTRSTMWRVHNLLDEPILSSFPLDARVDGSLTLADVAPIFDGVDRLPFTAFVGSSERLAIAFRLIASTALQLSSQQV